jgi:hypothetical protein
VGIIGRRTEASRKECEEVEALLGTDSAMISIWKDRLRMYAGPTPLKQWLIMAVGLEYRLRIPRLAKRHLDLLVKWVRYHVPQFKKLLSYGDYEQSHEELEASETPQMEPLGSGHSTVEEDHGLVNAARQFEAGPGVPFQDSDPRSQTLDQGPDEWDSHWDLAADAGRLWI